jgi:hypothetical protein
MLGLVIATPVRIPAASFIISNKAMQATFGSAFPRFGEPRNSIDANCYA